MPDETWKLGDIWAWLSGNLPPATSPTGVQRTIPTGYESPLASFQRETLGTASRAKTWTPSNKPEITEEPKKEAKGNRSWLTNIIQQLGIDIPLDMSPEDLGLFLTLFPLLQQQQELRSREQQGLTQQKTAEAQTQAKAYETGYNTYLQQQRQAQMQNYLSNEMYQNIGAVASRNALAAQMSAAADKARMELQGRQQGFETMREQIMASTAPRDWVVREKARLAVNPYTVMVKNFQGYQGVSSAQPQEQIEQYALQIPQNPQVTYTGSPELPAEVAGFTRGSKEWGAPAEVASGQKWGTTTPSTQEMLFGYLEGLGQQPADYLAQMQAMLPNAPTKGRSWTPYRART